MTAAEVIRELMGSAQALCRYQTTMAARGSLVETDQQRHERYELMDEVHDALADGSAWLAEHEREAQ